ncbi:DUF3530 family protein [Planctobacterium marinum]|uniref:DUF3530 family protein n=1 Tax=Planctobacterium marinum TaxID=1631968 RepID=UPI001E2E8F99|nr:DUF3530 family protein [Planctobacterium marinum]MCC2605292.1 alpha/beta hydrolase family protein [Planctobacterium marinum]
MRLFPLVLLLLNSLLCSPDSWSQEHIDDLQKLKFDVERGLRPETFRTLLLGEEETVVVIQESNQALSKGAAILVGETGKNGASESGLAALAPLLNDFGWTTILVTAPSLDFDTDQDSNPVTSAQGTPASDAANTDPNNLPPANQRIPSYSSTPIISESLFTQQEQDFQLLMNAVEQERQNYPGFALVVAQGTSAAWLAKLYGDQELPEPDAIVTIGVNWPQHELNILVPRILARAPIPVLDLYNQFDSDWTLTTAKERKVEAIKSLKLHYRQREIIGPRFSQQQYDYLAREIHGWLTYMGW